jgi:antitoxin HigA-1
MPMKNPPHPGRSIKNACLIPLGLSVTDVAAALGVARHTLSRVLNGQAGVSAEMAIRFEKAGWSNADHWMRLQAAYDLAQARQRAKNIRVKKSIVLPAHRAA